MLNHIIVIIEIIMKNSRIRLSWIAIALAVSACCGTGNTPAAISSDDRIEKKIDSILSDMTLEEKIGQMTQLTIGVITDSTGYALSEEMLDTVIGKYKVGSILNAVGNVSQPREVYADVIRRIQEKSLESTGIPCIYGLDQIHGASYVAGATFFPQGINMAASFNRELSRRGGEVTAYESRAALVPWTFSPTMDLGRDTRWSRLWESYGEDPYLSSEMATAAVEGMQGDDPGHIDKYHIATCIKHYLGYGVPVSGQDRTPAIIAENDLREKFFAPFKECIQAGALSLMVNSASINGVPCHCNKELLTGWVKEDLNWDGMIVTDWNDINNLYYRERVASSKKDAVRLAINAGIDMAMVPSELQFCRDLKELVEEGAVPMSRIDDAVRRVLRLKFRIGLFEEPVWDISAYDKFCSEEFAADALQAAVESMVLLKNSNDILPLEKGTKILLTGPNADAMRCLNGGWSYSWQGDRADEFAASYNTIKEALYHKFGRSNVIYEPGVQYAPAHNDNWQEETVPGIGKAVRAAAGADVIIACVGENSYCETPGNMKDLNLSENQKNLVKALARTGKPLILVLNGGRPRIINDIEPLSDAVVDIMLPGNHGGDALAELLAGNSNFSGKLPFTYPKYVHAMSTYDHKPSEKVGTMAGEYNYSADVHVQWTFGYGLSYTTFEYSDLKVDKTSFGPDDILNFEVTVKNTGDRAGKESVLLYSEDLVASIIPDVRRLRAFEKIELEPGVSATVEFAIPASDLAFVGADGKWRLESGDFKIYCGSENLSIRCTEDKIWKSPNIL